MLRFAQHLCAHRETLRFAQGDNTFPILLVKVHYSRCTEAYAPAAAWIFPFNGLAIAGDVACSTFEAMLIGEVHFSSEQLKQARRAHVDAGGRIAAYTLLAIEANMRRFIDFKAH
jgi:hypothetical protein